MHAVAGKPQQQTAFVGAITPAVAPSVVRSAVTASKLALKGSSSIEPTRSISAEGGLQQAALLGSLCGLATVLAHAGVGRQRRRRGDRGSGGRRRLLAMPLERGSAGSSSEDAAKPSGLAVAEPDVEQTVAEFVPKISALQDQAELLRSGELAEVIQTMKALRKRELGGVFSEVDQLLAALVGAIDGLRDSALTIRKSELREHFEDIDRQARGWVSNVEKDAVESLTGFRYRSPEKIDTIMEVHVVGLSHHKAPVEVREQLAVPQADWNAYARELMTFSQSKSGFVVPEIAVLSTCNRFELYFASSEINKYAARECVHAFLRYKSRLSREALEPYLFTHSGGDATRHLFEVSSGLDSLVLGEAQILAQVKACHEHCIQKADSEDESVVPGSGGKIIAKMLNAGIRIGKLVRTRTKIGKGSVSISSAAVELMMAKSLSDLKKYASKVNICIVGAGKMSRLLLIALYSKDPQFSITLVNRNTDRAQDLLDEVRARGGENAKVAPLEEMWDIIGRSDVVFTATASKEPIIEAKDLQPIVQRNLMLVDISVPLNVAKDCADVEKVHSYNVDDLKKVVQANADKRQSEVLKAKRFIDAEVDKFKVWQASQGAVPYLAALQAKAENIRRAETEKMARSLKGLHEKERQAVDKLTKHIIDQLFRPLYYSMKDDEDIGAKRNKIWALKSMFNLEPLEKRRVLDDPNLRPKLTK
eukprot:CAMPEP_0172668952 /NCGR_PEP_ID=MMETSP1074-20121228/9380_1 /TAXON_ID=2916 /ORGANISM="Ceratium fusus, Strain PA161109" /LENGTH=704 /DNA_ID=CAMNT_0013485669 /DNA_START=84 /DNA_END=2198 /DNA_ORIENTATION=-